jgi:hypothetical protein
MQRFLAATTVSRDRIFRNVDHVPFRALLPLRHHLYSAVLDVHKSLDAILAGEIGFL